MTDSISCTQISSGITITNIVITLINIVVTVVFFFLSHKRLHEHSLTYPHVVAQASLESQGFDLMNEDETVANYPSWLKNELQRRAFDSLPDDIARTITKKLFLRKFYGMCSVCNYNVFQFQHRERCHPRVVVQSSLPGPSDISVFTRYGRDDLSSDNQSGTIQRVDRIRADVRFIEERLIYLGPIIEAIRQNQTGSGTTQPPPPPGSSNPPTSTAATVAAAINHRPTDNTTSGSSGEIVGGSPGRGTVRPVGNGGFPETLEGMLARILYNQRIATERMGVVFQASLDNAFPQLTRAALDRIPVSFVAHIGNRTLTVTNDIPLQGDRLWVKAVVTYADTSAPGISFLSFDSQGFHEQSAPTANFTNSGRAVSGFSTGTSIVPPTGTIDPSQETMDQAAARRDAVNRNLRTLMQALGAQPVIVVQATVEHVLHIADTDQVLEPPKDTKLADTPMEEQLNEIDRWNVKNVLCRPTLIARAIWNAQPAATELAKASFPNQWLNNIGQNVHFFNLVNMFTMVKTDVVFRVVVNSTPMYGGHLALGFDFFSRLHDLALLDNAKSLDSVTVSGTDPIYLDISEGTTVELTVPFSAVSQYLSRQHYPFSSSHMGTVFVHAMSNLYKPATAPDVEVRLYAYARSPDVAVLQEPEIHNFIVPQASIVKTITSFAHSFIPNMKDVYPLALEDGFHVQRESTCRVEDVCSAYGLLRTFQWTTSHPNGDQIGQQIQVHPMAHQIIKGTTERRLATRLAHLGRHYSYWNGTLEYKIMVSCSKSHAGKFYIVYESGPSYRAAPNVVEGNAHILFDVQQIHELEFSMPFASPTPWKPTYLGHPFADVTNTGTGTIRLISADGIKSALSPNSDITINIFVRAGKDFQYAVPRNGLQGKATYGEVLAQVSLTSLSPRLLRSQEDFNDIYKVLRRFTPLGLPISTDRSQILVIPVRPLHPKALEANSISAVVAGFSFWRGSMSYKFKVASATLNRSAFEVFHIPTMGIPPGMGDNYYKWMDPADVTDIAASGSFSGAQTFHADIDKEWEVTVPYYSMYDHLHIPLVHHTGNGHIENKLPLLSTNNGCLVIRALHDGTLPVEYTLSASISCGQDFTLLAPTAFPPLVKTKNSAIGKNFEVVAQATLETNAEDQGLLDMYKDLQNILSRLSKLSTTLEGDVEDNTQEYFSRIIEESIVSLIKRAKLSLEGWIKEILPDVDWRLLASSFIGGALVYLLRDQLTSFTGKLVLGALATTISHKVLSKLMHYVNDFMNPQIRVQVGAGFDVQTITQLCCGVIAVLLNMDFKKGISGFVKNIGELGKSLAGVNSGVNAVRVFSQFVSDNIVPSLNPEDSLTLRSLMIDSVSILDEVYELNLEEMRVACHTQKEIKDRVLKCDGRLQELYKLTLMNPCSPGIVNALRSAMIKMDKLRTEVMAYKGEDGYRLDPFHISVYGPPGIGKSAMMNQLNDDLIQYHGLPTTNKVYTRSPENVYWDNYKGQTTTMFDDLGQIAATNPPSDLSEMISLKSNAPYMVHMASIAEKGTYFTSTFIISSTNFKLYNDCTFVKEKTALHRRRNILVEMMPTTWVDRQEEDRPPVNFDAGLFSEDGYARFRFLDSITATPTTEWMSYDAFTTLACQHSEVYLRTQKDLVDRQQKVAKASPAIQAIIDARDDNGTIPGVVINNEFQPNAEAQGLLDALPDDESRAKMLARWKRHFDNAFYWRDYGALSASFSDMERFDIAAAIRTRCSDGLSAAQKVVYSCYRRSEILQKRSATVLETARDQSTQVGRYFKDLYASVPKDRRKVLASALVALGALGVGYTLYSSYSNSNKDLNKSNIPMEIFTEGDESYQSKQRSQPPSKAVMIESGIDDYKTGRSRTTKVLVESGIDDYKTRRGQSQIVIEALLPSQVPTQSRFDSIRNYITSREKKAQCEITAEGAAEFEEWRAKHGRNLIPYKFELDTTGWVPRLGGISKEWKDFQDWCDLHPNVNRETGACIQLESGIDDYKTRRGQSKIIVEGAAANPMIADVPEEVLTLSEEDMIAYLSMDSAPPTKKLQTVESVTSSYQVTELEPQYSTDLECSQFVQNKLLDNMGLIAHMKSGYRMRCLAINDAFIVLPKHFFLLSEANWQEGDLFKFVIRGKVYEQDFHLPNLLIKPNRDLAMYVLSSRISGARSIMNQIASRNDHATYKTTDGALVSLSREKDGSTYINRHYLPVIHRMTEAEKDRTVYKVGSAVHRLLGYTYSASTLNGDCGSILLQHNVRVPGKIIGLHVAAQTGYAKAFSELLVREEVEDMMASLKSTTGYITSGSVLQTLDLALKHGIIAQGSISKQFQHLNSDVTIVGSVPRDMQKRTPNKTEIKPSPLQGVIDIEPLTEPAILDPKDPRCLSGRDPLIKTVGDYGLGSRPFSTVHLNLVKEHQISKFRKYDGYINKRILSLKEAINGIPGVDYADAMNMKSAEGSFWNLSRPFWAHNKSWMFENLAEEGQPPNYKIDFSSGLLQKLVHRLKEAREGRRVLSTSFECLKDERRGHKKTRPPPDATEEEKKEFTPGTRSFSILPVDYNILVRQYFWDFAAMIMKHRGELGPQVGIDPCSIEWTGLMKRLLATSAMGFAGDYKNYDRQTPAEFMDVAVDIINGWYEDGPMNAQIRKVLMGEAYDRLTIVRDAYLHIDKGLPSGFPLTVIVNSVNNDTYKYCSWLALAPPEYVALDKCDELTDSVYYGDDNDHAIDPRAAPFFNLRTVGEFLEEHGVVLTDEHKNHWSVAPALVPVESTSFLKRLFTKHQFSHFYLAPLEKKSIEDRLLWVTDSKYMSDEELLFENIRNSLRDAFHWGPAYFVELKTKIDRAIATRYPDPEMRRRMMCDVTYGSEEYKWIQTCKGMDQMSSDPILKDVFGF